MNKNILITIFVLVLLVLGAGFLLSGGSSNGEEQKSDQTNNNSTMNELQEKFNSNQLPAEYQNKKAVVQTNYGQFTMQFFDNDAPLAVENFIRLSQEGKYNNVPVHRIVNQGIYIIQSGDFTNGNGTGGYSIYGTEFPDELDPSTESFQTGYVRGTVAMANRGPDTNGSQFFINFQDNNNSLAKSYTIFAKIIEGMDTVDKIASVPVAGDIPQEDIRIEQVIIQDK